MLNANFIKRRIAQNAGWLYLRLAVNTVAGLLAVRLVVRGLGVDGYGAYSAIAGVVAFIYFLRWSLELTVRRFLGVAIGRGDETKVAETFSAGCTFVLAACVLFLVASETAGVWFAGHRLVVGVDYRDQLWWVFQISIVTFSLQTLRMPYEALIIASERMSFFAKASLVESLLALGAAAGAGWTSGNRLETYAVLLLCESAAVLLLYAGYCRKRLSERSRLVAFPMSEFRAQAAFSLKSLPSDFANVVKSDGLNLVINAYGGPAYNATNQMASSVGTSIYGVIANFQQASFQQIVRQWAGAADSLDAEGIMAFTVRCSALLVGIFVFPLLLFTRPILSFWIGSEMPPQAEAFVRCIAVHYFFSALTSPLHTAILATGRIGFYQMLVAAFMILGFGTAWGLLSLGFPIWCSVGVVALANALSFAYRVVYMKVRMGLCIGRFFVRLIAPVWYNCDR